jgi:hypothetical protein
MIPAGKQDGRKVELCFALYAAGDEQQARHL